MSTVLLMVSMMLFPTVSGKNLEGEQYTLPEDFTAPLTLAIVAFQREQQALVDTWLPTVRSWAEEHDSFQVYELPTIPSGYRLMRWMIDGGMRSGIPDPVARATTITLYIDTSDFRDALNIPDRETIHLFLLNQNGEIVWRIEGPMTEEARNELQQTIETQLGER